MRKIIWQVTVVDEVGVSVEWDKILILDDIPSESNDSLAAQLAGANVIKACGRLLAKKPE